MSPMNSTNYRPDVFAKSILGAVAFAFATAAGAVTMHSVIDFDKRECDVFKKMIIEADVAHLTDKQLCDFRFARLPSSKTAGFTFPNWTGLKVDDPVEVFRKASEGNMRPGRPEELGYPRPDIIESACIRQTCNLKARGRQRPCCPLTLFPVPLPILLTRWGFQLFGYSTIENSFARSR
jgi:hypothetical protein